MAYAVKAEITLAAQIVGPELLLAIGDRIAIVAWCIGVRLGL